MRILKDISPKFDAKGTEINESIAFSVPLISEAAVPASFLSDFRGSRSCLVPQKKERVQERVPFERVPLTLCVVSY